MTEDIIFTGERYMPTIGEEMMYEHLHRYALCQNLVKDKIVLDVASGEGYGSALLSRYAQKVYGVDIASDTVAHAQKKYADRPNLSFLQGSCTKIPLPNHSVDYVISFETIEHIVEHNEMLQEIKRVLKPDGTLVISTPDKRTYSDNKNFHNAFHVKELYLNEFSQLLQKYFQHLQLYGQRLITPSLISPLTPYTTENYTAFTTDVKEIAVQNTTSLPDPVYIIACCSNALISDTCLLPPSIFLDSGNDLYQAHETLAAWAQRVDKEHQESSAWAQRLNIELDEANKRYQTLEKEYQERSAWAQKLDQQLEACAKRYQALEAAYQKISKGKPIAINQFTNIKLKISTAWTSIKNTTRTVVWNVLYKTYKLLPISQKTKQKCVSAVFTHLGFLFKHTISYKQWQNSSKHPDRL